MCPLDSHQGLRGLQKKVATDMEGHEGVDESVLR